jgi:hypothetical protein
MMNDQWKHVIETLHNLLPDFNIKSATTKKPVYIPQKERGFELSVVNIAKNRGLQ